jgi:MFS superfamily sulfate permease-like transporter
MFGKMISIILGCVILFIMYSVFDESENKDNPNHLLRRFILIYCILTAFLLGFIINLNLD